MPPEETLAPAASVPAAAERVEADQGPLLAPPRVSVVIPAFNEAKHIGRVLQALCGQTLPRTEFEVIVVDNGSTDETAVIAHSFAERLPLRLVARDRCSISAVRNFGASFARGETIAFLDGDCITEPFWLEQALSVSGDRGVWGAHYLVPRDATWVGRVWAEFQAKPRAGAVSFIPASNLFVSREQFLRLGGFAEDTQTSEDVEFCSRARRLGLEISAYPEIAVYHEGTPRTLRHFYRQNRWHGATVLRNFVRDLPSTRNLGLVALSLYTLVMFWAMLLVSGSLLVEGHPGLAVVPALLLIAPALLLALAKTLPARRPREVMPLAILYMTYLLARAAAATQVPKRNHR